MTRRLSLVCLALALACATLAPPRARAADLAGPLADLQLQLAAVSSHAPGRVGIAMEDLATGMTSGYNDTASLPAASTIKIPVMVEVFKQMEAGTIDLNRVVTLRAVDRDWGWGDMAGAPVGTRRTVKQLLWLMITNSDNTATNELIRLVGRGDINATMSSLGLHATHLGDYIRSETDTIRYALRTSPHDMLVLLDKIARDKMVDTWSSRQMLAILEGQKHNSLLPVPLPHGTRVAHKTGSLHDTLNDVGIVYANDEPYVIAVMTTELPDLGLGRAFIHKVSRIAYDGFGRLVAWRADRGIAAFSDDSPALATERSPEASPLEPVAPGSPATAVTPDERMWNVAPVATAAPAVATAQPG